MFKEINKKSRSGSIRLHVLPVLVWLTAVAAVVGLFYQRSQQYQFVGLATGESYRVAANCDGRVKDVSVELFDQVQQGETVAVVDTVLDNENIQEQLETARARIEHLMAQMIPTQQQLLTEAKQRKLNWSESKRRFAGDVEQTRLEILRLRTQLETDRIVMEDHAVELTTVSELVEEEAVSEYELQRVHTQYELGKKKVEEDEELLAQAGEDLQEAKKRYSQFVQQEPNASQVAGALEVIRKEIAVQEKVVDELEARRQDLVLKAPFGGRVSEILRRPGESVLAGEAILSLSQRRADEIVVYASQNELGNVKEGSRVKIVKRSEPRKVARSQIVQIGPTVRMLPEQLWRDPARPQWGNPMKIKVPPELNLKPGEIVGVEVL